MKQLYLEIAAAKGITFRTGTSLCNFFLNRTYKKEYLIVAKIPILYLKRIVEKLDYVILKETLTEIETKEFHIRLIENIQELNEQRDFNFFNIYLNPLTETYYDPFQGVTSIRTKTVVAPKKLFLENPIKMVEACRLAGDFGFTLHVETWFDLYDNARILKLIPPLVVRDEIEKILTLPTPSTVFKQLQETRLLEYIIPELAACETIVQSKRAGINNVFEHIMYALDACENRLDLRLVILFHDIAKPQTLQCDPDGTIHFFKHEIEGSKIAKSYLKYWNFSKELIHKIPHLILHHMFDADPRITDKAVRRLIRKVGEDYIYDLLKIREADRSGIPQKISMRKIKLLRKKIDRILSSGMDNGNDSNGNSALPVPTESKTKKANKNRGRAKNKDIRTEEIIRGTNRPNSGTNGTVLS